MIGENAIHGHAALMCGEPLVRAFSDSDASLRCQLLCGEIEFPVKKCSGAPTVSRGPIQSEEDVHKLQVPDGVSHALELVPDALKLARRPYGQ